ncbi:putative succinate:quinone oxidoreductase transmembrane anchor subunit family protein [Candidatus Cyrtobacter comes]|uniref:Succinate:quinone oxidoreductase transmembrane anchor subunit family protein n=1 Tax=Candidatus Cyrtobacter comes TaxID=675776 RepID=A0ABU5L6K6_9RICK|nr:putative succinate:quinone oxidoreductase transmembrane anchor subunit family protein [Candidatus Cyrtobacter comes]
MSYTSLTKTPYRISSFILVLLSIRFIFLFAYCAKHGFIDTFSQSMGSTCNATLMLLFIVVISYNILHEMKVVIEDYIKCQRIKNVCTALLYLAVSVTAVGLFLSIAYMYFVTRTFAFCG